MKEQTELNTVLKFLKIGELKPSSTNPRKHNDEKEDKELQASIEKVGILQPITVRAVNGHFEVIAGERRFRAAQAIKMAEVPVIVRKISDEEALEFQIIENLQRKDIHPMEEAEGFFNLSRKPGYDAAKIADRIGRSEKYVYDRMKLLQLTKEAKKLFLEDKFTSGHAILLARLSPSEQAKAIDPRTRGALFEYEGYCGSLLDDDDDDDTTPLKARSVREFASWIDENVRFDRDKVDPMLFPETVQTLSEAKKEKDKIVPITKNHHIQESGRAEERTIVPTSWKRADGKSESKTCENSVTGVFVIGPGRGTAMKVCIAKEKCKVHWGQWQKDRAQRAKLSEPDKKSFDDKQKAREEKQAREREERNQRLEKAMPLIKQSILTAIQKLPATAGGYLANIVVGYVNSRTFCTLDKKDILPRGKTVEDLLRHVASVITIDALEDDGIDRFGANARALGVDLDKLIEEAAPVKVDKPTVEVKVKSDKNVKPKAKKTKKA